MTSSDRRRHVRQWAAGYLGVIEHERRVAQIADALLDLTHPLHQLGGDARDLLRLAALVHDVGRSINDDDHPRLGAQMLLRAVGLDLPRRTRRHLAFLTLYHRGRVPARGDERLLETTDDREKLRLILALLRAADALDGRQLESPKLVFALHGRSLHITCHLEGDCPKAMRCYTRRKKFKLLEDLLDCQVLIDVRRSESLRLVA